MLVKIYIPLKSFNQGNGQIAHVLEIERNITLPTEKLPLNIPQGELYNYFKTIFSDFKPQFISFSYTYNPLVHRIEVSLVTVHASPMRLEEALHLIEREVIE